MFRKILLLVGIGLLGCQNNQNQALSPTIPSTKPSTKKEVFNSTAKVEKKAPATPAIKTKETQADTTDGKNLVATTTATPATSMPQKYQFPWLQNYETINMLANRIATPPDYERLPAPNHSFAEWLRNIPLKEGNPPVYLFNGQKKGNQQAQFAVINMDVGKEDLQQCADAVMRLRAEYLLATNQLEKIHFNFTNGDKCDYPAWKKGVRPVINGNKVSWLQKAQPDASYANFKKYMTKVFQFAGTHSLSKEMKPVRQLADIEAGDVFIYGGFPGHAVMVMDVAVHRETGEKVFLLAQSYMPAQEMHILKNPNVGENTPWYPADFEGKLFTPEWTFEQEQLKRF
ncbi:MAG: DUF4846 domain-containing protein [Chitinophagales bacterium]